MNVTCPKCYAESTDSDLCSRCGKILVEFATEEFISDERLLQCPVCGCRHLYRQKDFNRKLGIGIMLVGALLAYWTYGISLVVVTLLDFFLFRRVGEVACCYQCLAQFRGKTVAEVEPFNLQLHDYYKNLRERDQGR